MTNIGHHVKSRRNVKLCGGDALQQSFQSCLLRVHCSESHVLRPVLNYDLLGRIQLLSVPVELFPKFDPMTELINWMQRSALMGSKMATADNNTTAILPQNNTA